MSYKNLDKWFEELREHSGNVPCIVLANKIDIDYKVTSKSFAFASRRGLPLFFVSAADGTNVVKAFTAALAAALQAGRKTGVHLCCGKKCTAENGGRLSKCPAIGRCPHALPIPSPPSFVSSTV